MPDGPADLERIHALPAEATVPPLADALTAVESLLRRYVVFARAEEALAVTLWVAHTHVIDAADATPYLGISSPEKQSGKTRLLECLVHLVHGCSGITVLPTAATIYRTLEAVPGATLLIDELDAAFKDRSDKYEEVRGILNAGHRRGATIPRSVPGPKGSWTVKQFPVFGAKALAGIGKLPDTISDRSIPIRMRKRKMTESKQQFRERVFRGLARSVVTDLVGALAGHPPAIEADIPEAIPDRAGDAWEPLFAIADAAGEGWPERARVAAIVLHANRASDDSLGLRLLADVRLVFGQLGVERIHTTQLIDELSSDDESPWASDRWPLSPHRLGRLLDPFQISSKQMRIGGESLKGYERASFVDSWERYLGDPLSPTEAEHRNTDREARFDVSIPTLGEPAPAAMPQSLPIEEDYPASAWDPDWLPRVERPLQ